MSMRRLAGFTLIELVVLLVVLAIAGAGMALAIQRATQASADPLIKQQATAIAQAYLEEIALRPFCDPDFVSQNVAPTDPGHCIARCTNAACTGTTKCGGEAFSSETRANFDDICDYASLVQAPTDQYGNALASLAGYTVTVTVNDTATFGSLSGAAGQVLRVDVGVRHSLSSVQSTLSTFRANY
jgi:MSHA pilin protein MshD